ncbi:MAG: adhesin [Methanobrevibacter sp.]|uniref:adhesin n=1 Tax=Methanobrevibacter sp. TaxID=66852 RepID=UPI0026E023EF|nr:adhesin [Methanobrevibacter sp.]MDO5848408.1 adhesin [Methanobrevibacter sp.]
MKKPKFTFIDYLIIIIVIVAILFAFMHITSDNQNETESSSYDSSTLNKIVEKYLGYYNKGEIVHTTVDGTNSKNNEHISVKGEIIWMDDERGNYVKALVKSGNETYLCGLYKDIPAADIYIEKMSLEVDGSKYSNLTEFTIKAKNISSTMDLNKGLENYSNYEISTGIAVDNLDSLKFQQLNNVEFENGRVPFKLTDIGIFQKLMVVRASPDDITTADNILGNINGETENIFLRVYNCTANEQKFIEDNFDVVNVKTY